MRSPAPEYACAHPGKAGRFCAFAMCGPVDSRFRGNDGNYFSSFPRKRESTKNNDLREVPYNRESTGSTGCGCRPVRAGCG